jgi:hypothetical protein
MEPNFNAAENTAEEASDFQCGLKADTDNICLEVGETCDRCPRCEKQTTPSNG